MPQLKYVGLDALTSTQRSQVYLDHDGRPWQLTAVVIRYDRNSQRETGRTGFLRRIGPGGCEWETPMDMDTLKATVHP